MRIEDIKTGLIDIVGTRRVADPDFAKALAEDFTKRGQEREIDVVETDERFRLITGLHRVEAAKINGSPIRAKVWSPSEFANEASIKLAEIAENFIRRELTVLDRAFDIAAWREIYERVSGAVKPGKKGISRKVATNTDDELMALSSQFSGSFTEASTAAFGLSRDAVFRALKIARISDDVRRVISLHKIADNQSELLALAAESTERQARIAALLTADQPHIFNVAEAIRFIDQVGLPDKPAPWAKVSDSFNKLSEPAKRRFIEENWDYIEHLMAERQAV